jgi:hypothetical protein
MTCGHRMLPARDETKEAKLAEDLFVGALNLRCTPMAKRTRNDTVVYTNVLTRPPSRSLSSCNSQRNTFRAISAEKELGRLGRQRLVGLVAND